MLPTLNSITLHIANRKREKINNWELHSLYFSLNILRIFNQGGSDDQDISMAEESNK
jgi:hypothetical protein